MVTMELTTLYNMVISESGQNQPNTQYTALLQNNIPKPPTHYLPSLQTEYITDDPVTTRRPQPSIDINAKLVLKVETAKWPNGRALTWSTNLYKMGNYKTLIESTKSALSMSPSTRPHLPLDSSATPPRPIVSLIP